jgi:hypothetical protein
MRSPAQVAIPVIVPRAVVVWGVTRLMFAALPMAIGEPFGSISPSPVAVVLFAGIVGLIDVSSRREQILWDNLSVKPRVLYALYAAAAIPAELMLALALP